MAVVRAIRWGALVAGILVARGAAAATPPGIADFVGTWTRSWPAGACQVTVEIRADGTMTTLDGARRIDASFEVQGGPDDQGFVAVARHETQDNAGAACTREPASPQQADATRPAEDGTPARELQAILPFAHGDAMALCRFANMGGCDDWYERAPPGAHRPAGPPRHDLVAAVERQFYALIPENRATFELALANTGETAPFADRDAPGGMRMLACERSARFTVVGHGATMWNFLVASCTDAASVERLALKLIAGLPADLSNMPEQARRQYGLYPLDRKRPDGARTIYAFDEVRSVDAGTLFQWAVHVDARRRHAILVMGVDMGTLLGPPPQFAANPLYHDPAAIMQALVERLARDPDAAR